MVFKKKAQIRIRTRIGNGKFIAEAKRLDEEWSQT